MNCSDLAWDDLTALLVWVDKKNSVEFLFNFIYYLYIYYMAYMLLFLYLLCDLIILYHLTLWYITCDMLCDTFPYSFLYSKLK